MPADDEGLDDDSADSSRRRVLKYAALVGLLGSGTAGALRLSQSEPQPVSTPPEPLPTDDIEPVAAVPPLVTRYAPDLDFGALEKWYPTDPRLYRTATADGPVVDRSTTSVWVVTCTSRCRCSEAGSS